MINGNKKQSLLSAIAMACILTTNTVYAEDKSNTSNSSHSTIIGGFKSMSGMDSSVVSGATNNIAYQPPVVEPPQPANNTLVGHGETKPPASIDKFGNVKSDEVALEWMAAYIDTKLQGQVVGYAYAINKDGKVAESNAYGLARTADDGQMDMSIHTRSFIASVTKQLTAIAMIKMLHQAGLSIDTPIADYLPADWDKGNGFNNSIWGLTFEDLMQHRTGLGQAFQSMKDNDDQESLDQWGNDWDGLEFVVSNGSVPGASYSYKNANYALLRILLPEVWVQMGGAPYKEVTAGNHSIMFLAYLYQNVLEPAGIYSVGCWLQPAQQEALAYSMDFVEEGGVGHQTSFNSCGGHSGLRMSAYELAKYLAYLRHTNDILHYTQLALANQELLGWSPSGGSGIYWKGGDQYSTYTMAAENNMGGIVYAAQNEITFRKSSHACVMIYPNGYEASIVVNSEYKTGFDSSACGVLKDAYEFAVD